MRNKPQLSWGAKREKERAEAATKSFVSVSEESLQSFTRHYCCGWNCTVTSSAMQTGCCFSKHITATMPSVGFCSATTSIGHQQKPWLYRQFITSLSMLSYPPVCFIPARDVSGAWRDFVLLVTGVSLHCSHSWVSAKVTGEIPFLGRAGRD